MKVRDFLADELPPLRWKGELALPGDVPIDLEIGCGVGLHPILYATKNPGRVLIAIEHTKTRFSKFRNRLQHHPHIKNIIPIHEDAVLWVSKILLEHSVDKIFLLYPNPYPKARHLNKRWYAMPFMSCLLSKLKIQGTLTIATNEKFYGEGAFEYFTSYWELELKDREVIQKKTHPEYAPRSHFEKKYFERGDNLYRLTFSKVY